MLSLHTMTAIPDITPSELFLWGRWIGIGVAVLVTPVLVWVARRRLHGYYLHSLVAGWALTVVVLALISISLTRVGLISGFTVTFLILAIIGTLVTRKRAGQLTFAG